MPLASWQARILASPRLLWHLLLVPATTLGAVTLFLAAGSPPLTAPGSQRQLHQEQRGAEKIGFELVSEGKLTGKDITSASFHNYRSEDGISLQRRVESYRSAARAREEMQRMIKRAKKVIERGPKLDREGQRRGERVVLLWRPWRAGRVQALVLWTDGPDLYVLESPSLRHVLAFEEQVYR